MSDRELLELAAKAARIMIEPDSAWSGYSERHGFYRLNCDGTNTEWRWNPLTDDGDAMRLAVKLEMSVVFGANYVIINGDVQEPTVSNSGDVAAIVRRAIVRAAAEIGRTQ